MAMSEVFEPSLHEPTPLPAMADNLTTAPGDLPIPEIMARSAAQKGQFRHDNIVIPSTPQPGQAVEIWATTGEDLPLAQASIFYTTDGSLPDLSAPNLPLERVRTSWEFQAGYLTHWRALLPAQPAQTVVRYRIGGWATTLTPEAGQAPDVWAQDGQGFWFHFSGEQALTTFAYNVEEPAPALPAWAQDAIIYQIFLDRFRTGESDGSFPANTGQQDFHGGTLRGVCDALPYLAELGVNCLWLSPINPAESYHRYDATDFYNVDPRLGTNADLKTLTDQAHALGMRVLLDFVPSHCSWHHPAFLRAQQDRSAPSFEWFTFTAWPEDYKCFLETVPSLPSFNGENQGARDYIIDSAIQWVRDYGIDGFRLDHAIGQGMDFWTAFRRATRAVAPEVLTVGEVTDTPDCMASYQGKLDGVLDFPLASAFRHTFGIGDWNIEKFEYFLSSYEQFMAAGPGRVSFLDNHDMDRFLFTAGNNPERLKLAALCQFTLNAPPVIYYGTEVGMSQQQSSSNAAAGGDAQVREDMLWNPAHWNHDLLTFYRALVHLRRETPVLRQGQRRTIHLNPAQGTYAYARTGSGQGELVSGDMLALFNLSRIQQVISLPANGTGYRCLLATNEQPRIRKSAQNVEIQLAPHSGAIISLE